jgi:hypothetical protein
LKVADDPQVAGVLFDEIVASEGCAPAMMIDRGVPRCGFTPEWVMARTSQDASLAAYAASGCHDSATLMSVFKRDKRIGVRVAVADNPYLAFDDSKALIEIELGRAKPAERVLNHLRNAKNRMTAAGDITAGGLYTRAMRLVGTVGRVGSGPSRRAVDPTYEVITQLASSEDTTDAMCDRIAQHAVACGRWDFVASMIVWRIFPEYEDATFMQRCSVDLPALIAAVDRAGDAVRADVMSGVAMMVGLCDWSKAEAGGVEELLCGREWAVLAAAFATLDDRQFAKFLALEPWKSPDSIDAFDNSVDSAARVGAVLEAAGEGWKGALYTWAELLDPNDYDALEALYDACEEPESGLYLLLMGGSASDVNFKVERAPGPECARKLVKRFEITVDHFDLEDFGFGRGDEPEAVFVALDCVPGLASFILSSRAANPKIVRYLSGRLDHAFGANIGFGLELLGNIALSLDDVCSGGTAVCS